MAMKTGRGSDQFPLRLPPGMRDQIKRAAEESGRSMNSEILDALREAFPEEPGLQELVDEVDSTIALLRDILENSNAGDITQSNKFLSVIGRLTSTNENLWKAIADERRPSIVKLDNEVLDDIEKLGLEWLSSREPELNDSLVNSLIRMSLDRIARGEENLKFWIGVDGAKRMVEFAHPASEQQE